MSIERVRRSNQSNAIERLKFDCRTQSNLNRILPRFSDSIEIRLRFDCVWLVRLRFDCVRLTSFGAQYFQATYQRHQVYQKALVASMLLPPQPCRVRPSWVAVRWISNTIESQSNAIESQSNQSNNYLEFGCSIEIRLRSTIEFQPFDRVRLRSIGSIAEPVRLTSSSGYGAKFHGIQQITFPLEELIQITLKTSIIG